MTITNPEAFMDGIWDWAILQDCFGDSKIEPTDIDGFVERKGYFLVLETKRPDVPVKQGQRITFHALKDTGLFTIIIIWGKKNNPTFMEVLYPPPKLCVPRMPCTLTDLRNVVSRWYDDVNKTNKDSEKIILPANIFYVNKILSTIKHHSVPAYAYVKYANIQQLNNNIIFSFTSGFSYHYRKIKLEYQPIIKMACQEALGREINIQFQVL